jgi:hypothetical protein
MELYDMTSGSKMEDGKRHRIDAPAIIGYYENGTIEYNMKNGLKMKWKRIPN